MIVVDTNVIASLYLPGPHADAAERALSKDPEWVAALLWRSELRNVLASLVRAERCPLARALEVLDAAHTLLEGASTRSRAPMWFGWPQGAAVPPTTASS